MFNNDRIRYQNGERDYIVRAIQEFCLKYSTNPSNDTGKHSTCMNTYTVFPNRKMTRLGPFQVRLAVNYPKLAHLFLLPLRIAVSGLNQIARFLLI
ncbi:hypothetical protein L5515_017009 [Caenorhabditis briggsae]|uniref:Uncharacterized protein n=1 Tax=Caenorhabditis briggsae TaxID=6238 RepID=A0AAE9FEF8_CAEBR|nr:hypothetical protein L5515_017009 [Caenorhabditis briggsae]